MGASQGETSSPAVSESCVSVSHWIWHLDNFWHCWNTNLETPSIIFLLTYGHRNSDTISFFSKLCFHLNYPALTVYFPSVQFGVLSVLLKFACRYNVSYSFIQWLKRLWSLSPLFQILLPQVTWMKFFLPWLFPPVSCFRGRWGLSAECPASRLGRFPGPASASSPIHCPTVEAKSQGSERGNHCLKWWFPRETSEKEDFLARCGGTHPLSQ